MLMRHLDLKNIGNAKAYASGWVGIHCPTAGEAAKVIGEFPWSPCLWARGERKKANFRAASWLALDFDQGLSLESAKKIFEPYVHVIGTTRNHQKEKAGFVADRFRVLLRASETIKDSLVYEESIRALCNKYESDPCAKDAARLFWPCLEIVSIQYAGSVFKPVDVSDIRTVRESWRIHNKQNYLATGEIPGWIKSFFKKGIEDGQRNATTYRIGRELRSLGFSESDTLNEILKSRIPSSDFTQDEIAATVKSSFK